MRLMAEPYRGRSHLIAMTLALPTLTSALGIDGGAIFQIVAAQTLSLDPRAIGVAFGLGVLSAPLQLLAARTPLWRARRNLRVFLAVSAAQCGLLALLVATGVAGTRVALAALAVTVIAEISLSVLFVPAWQPLLSYALTTEARQRLNSGVAAVGRGIAVLAVVAFGAAGDSGRALLLGAITGVALALGLGFRTLHAPDRPAPEPKAADGTSRRAARPLSQEMRRVILLTGVAMATGGWPLILVYAEEVLWPSANLGFLGATQIGGSLVAALAWRPTAGDLRTRARRAGAALLFSTVALAAVRAPITGTAEATLTVGSLAVAGAARATLGLALLELAHRAVDAETSVRGLTILDAVASTSLQVGLLLAGFLVSSSQGRLLWPLDPYRLYLLAGAAAVAIGLTMLPRLSPSR
jgi:hypothetical protein